MSFRWVMTLVVGVAMAARAAESQELAKLVSPSAKVQKLAGDMKFLEGPAWTNAKGGYLVFSDIPAGQIKKWTPAEGLTTFRTGGKVNGNIYDSQGRLVSADEGTRVIIRTEADGTVLTLADTCDGKRFNSPNDIVVKSDGAIYFTDPPYGLGKGVKEQPGNYVFRLDPQSKQVKPVVIDLEMPNGLCFSPDEKKLYVADSGPKHHIRVYDVAADGTVANGRIFCVIDKGGPDGIRCDVDGRLWSSAGDGIHIFTPEGVLIGRILVPEGPSNLCFGGADGRTLFITARTSLYCVPVNVTGAGSRIK